MTITKHSSYHVDDTQLYSSFKLHNQVASVQVIESCLNDINKWMLANMLKLNRDKTDLLVIGPKHKSTHLLKAFMSPAITRKLSVVLEL